MSKRGVARQPAQQAKGVGRSGVAPPVEHRWKPGQSGNPAGRPSAGAAVREWWNVMRDWTREQVEACMSDPATPMAKRTAAVQWLEAFIGGGTACDRIIEHTDGRATQNVNLQGDVRHSHEMHDRMARVLSDPAAVEAANVLARRMQGEDGDDAAEHGRN